MGRWGLFGASALVLLAGCAAEQPVYWARADGGAVAGTPARERQFAQDEAVCRGEMAKADSLSMAPAVRRLQADEDVYRGCMAARGYAPGRAP